MASTVYKITAGVPNLSSSGSTLFHICAGVPASVDSGQTISFSSALGGNTIYEPIVQLDTEQYLTQASALSVSGTVNAPDYEFTVKPDFVDPTVAVNAPTMNTCPYNDIFTGSNGSAPDSEKWLETDPDNAMDIQSNQLNYNWTDSAVGYSFADVTSIWHFEADEDFDIQVDFNDYTAPTPTSGQHFAQLLQIQADPDVQEDYSRIARLAHDSYGQCYRVLGYNDTDQNETNAQVSTSDTSGKLRITKTSGTVKCYYWSGSQWEWDGNASGYTMAQSYTGMSLWVTLTWYFTPNGTSETFSGDFDDFLISSGCNAVSRLPATVSVTSTLYAPSVSLGVTTQYLTQASALSVSGTVNAPDYEFTAKPDFVDPTVAVNAPTMGISIAQAASLNISQTLYGPDFDFVIKPDAVAATGTVNAPDLHHTVTPEFVDRTVSLPTPAAVQLGAPQTLVQASALGGNTVYGPFVKLAQAVTQDSALGGSTIYGPTVELFLTQASSLAVTSTLYAPDLDFVIKPDAVAATGTVNAPDYEFTVKPEVHQEAATIPQPTVSQLGAPQTVTQAAALGGSTVYGPTLELFLTQTTSLDVTSTIGTTVCQHSKFKTDFSDYTSDLQPSDWTERWNTSSATATVKDSSDPIYLGYKHLLVDHSSNAWHAASWDRLDGVLDIEILARVRWGNASLNSTAAIMLRCGGASGTEEGYFLNFEDSNNHVDLYEFNAGSQSELATFTKSLTFGVHYWVRFRAEGTALKYKVWTDGDAEPGAWTKEVVDTTHESGWAGIGSYRGDFDYFDFFSVALDGGTADGPDTVNAYALEQSTTVYGPDFGFVIKPESVAATGTVNAPDYEFTITPTFIDRTVSQDTPTVVQVGVPQTLVQAAPLGGNTVYGPQINLTVTQAASLGGSIVYEPNPFVSVGAGLIDQTTTVNAPDYHFTVKPESVSPTTTIETHAVVQLGAPQTLIQAAALGGSTVYSPDYEFTVKPNLMDQTVTIYEPDPFVSVGPDSIDQGVSLYAPDYHFTLKPEAVEPASTLAAPIVSGVGVLQTLTFPSALTATATLYDPSLQPRYVTDFSEYTDDTQPADWTERWHTGNGFIRAREDEGDYGNWLLDCDNSSTGDRYLASWDDLDSVAADVEILSRVRVNANYEHCGRIYVRGSGTTTTETAYFFYIQPVNDTVGIWKYTSGSSSSLDTPCTASMTIDVGTWYWVRMQVIGTAMKAKVWSGSYWDEPGAWTAEGSDNDTSAAGWVGVGQSSSSGDASYDYFSVAFNGGTPIEPPVPTDTISVTTTLAAPTVGLYDKEIQPEAIDIPATIPAPGVGGFVYVDSAISIAQTLDDPKISLSVQAGDVHITTSVPAVHLKYDQKLFPTALTITATTYGPTLDVEVYPGLITQGVTAQDPQVDVTVKPESVPITSTVNEPGLDFVVLPDPVPVWSPIGEPTVSTAESITAGLISQTVTAQDPTLDIQLRPERLEIAVTVPQASSYTDLIPFMAPGLVTQFQVQRPTVLLSEGTQDTYPQTVSAWATIGEPEVILEVAAEQTLAPETILVGSSQEPAELLQQGILRPQTIEVWAPIGEPEVVTPSVAPAQTVQPGTIEVWTPIPEHRAAHDIAVVPDTLEAPATLFAPQVNLGVKPLSVAPASQLSDPTVYTDHVPATVDVPVTLPGPTVLLAPLVRATVESAVTVPRPTLVKSLEILYPSVVEASVLQAAPDVSLMHDFRSVYISAGWAEQKNVMTQYINFVNR